MTKGNDLATIRDTVVSIGVAIILAFVLRAFVLEAFVIPTGSMAPRLMGRHRLVTCPECRLQFPLGPPPANSLQNDHPSCPNCSHLLENGYRNGQVLSGDRVLVLKYLYRFREPRRWDVVVFKNPQTNNENYIKRLAGLPGEVVRIIHGDVFYHPIADVNGDGVRDRRDLGPGPLDEITNWQIARKSHENQETMWQLISDNDYRPANGSRKRAWLEPWQAVGGDAWTLTEDVTDGATTISRGSRVFRYSGPAPGALRFAKDQPGKFAAVNAYNGGGDPDQSNGVDTCSDLKLETSVVPGSADGKLLLTLSNFGHEFAAEVSFDGTVRLLHRKLDSDGAFAVDWEGAELWGQATGPALTVGRATPVAITHADWRVTVWVDGEPVLVSDDEKQYEPPVAKLIKTVDESPASALFIPRAGITGLGGEFELWHTRVWRDVFYISESLRNGLGTSALYDYARDNYDEELQSGELRSGWGTMKNPIVLRSHGDDRDFDEFYMLGDNSPSSLDSRLWLQAAPSLRLYDGDGEDKKPRYRLGTVPRYNLIGKAFFVYWPAGHDLPIKWRSLPLVPNVGKMRRIR